MYLKRHCLEKDSRARPFALISFMSTIKVDPPHSSQNHAAITFLFQQRFLKYRVKDTNVFFSFFWQQYNFVSSPIPFECPEAILSSPLSSPTPHTMIMDSHSGVFTPVPCQPRVSTPYPVIDSVISGKGMVTPPIYTLSCHRLLLKIL